MVSATNCKASRERVAAWKALSSHLDSCFPSNNLPSLSDIANALQVKKFNLFAWAILRSLGLDSNVDADLELPCVQLVIAKLETKDESPWATVLLENIYEPETSNSSTNLAEEPTRIKYSMETLLELQKSPFSKEVSTELAVIAAQHNVWAKTFDKDRDLNWAKLQDLKRSDGTAYYAGSTRSSTPRSTYRTPRSNVDDSSIDNWSSEHETDRRHGTASINRPSEHGRHGSRDYGDPRSSSINRPSDHETDHRYGDPRIPTNPIHRPLRLPTGPSPTSTGFRRPRRANNGADDIPFVSADEKWSLISAKFAKDGKILSHDRLATTVTAYSFHQAQKPLDSLPKKFKDDSFQFDDQVPTLEMDLSYNKGTKTVYEVPTVDMELNYGKGSKAIDEVPTVDMELNYGKGLKTINEVPTVDMELFWNQSTKTLNESSMKTAVDENALLLAKSQAADGELESTHVIDLSKSSEVAEPQPVDLVELGQAEEVQVEQEEEEEGDVLEQQEDQDASEVQVVQEVVDILEVLEMSDQEEPQSEVKSNQQPAPINQVEDVVEFELVLSAPPPVPQIDAPADNAVAPMIAPPPTAANLGSTGTTSPQKQEVSNYTTAKPILNPPMDPNLVREYFEHSCIPRTMPKVGYPLHNNHRNPLEHGNGVYAVPSASPSRISGPSSPVRPIVPKNWTVEVLGADED